MRDAPPSAVHVAIEVMIPSSVTNDRVTEPTLYTEAGIPAYVRIELAPARTLGSPISTSSRATRTVSPPGCLPGSSFP